MALTGALWRVGLMSAFNRLRMNGKQTLRNVSEGLGFDRLYVKSPCNVPIEECSEINHMI